MSGGASNLSTEIFQNLKKHQTLVAEYHSSKLFVQEVFKIVLTPCSRIGYQKYHQNV